ncbi:MAG: restriction endonuclease [Planctomycetes bacterium]|nr:restriction endonuclease [Planctomycetota bacterium]
MSDPGNTLYYGDNLDILRRYIADETVDLAYLDPPFNSNATYNVLFAEQNGSRAAAQIKAFEDTWQWDRTTAQAFQEVVEAGGPVSRAMQAFRTFLGDSNMLAYLAMMAPRLVELRRALKPTGSIYLHCDPTASHYLKILMDAVFGGRNFRNELIWWYETGGIPQNDFSRKHDSILRYSKGDRYAFNPKEIMEKRSDEVLRRIATGHPSATRSTGQYRHPSDVWKIPAINAMAKERLGYPTQKPEALLERIIKASSNEGDIVLDPFCGCGTAVAVAQKLNRRWMGIDITHLAINLIKVRLRDAFGDGVTQTYSTIGEPTSLPDAETLAAQDPYQLQWWALGLVGARPAEGKKGPDKGIDGRLYFHDEGPNGKTKQVIFSVKAGKLSVPHVRDLRGVLDREQAAIGVLISMQEPTKPMKTEAAGAGFYDSPWSTRHPRMQLLTIGELLAGKGVDMPLTRDLRTFKKAPKAKRKTTKEEKLF